MKKYSFLLAAAATIAMTAFIASCENNANQKYNQYANPFVGAADNGHCNPGATVPFGNIQVGPQTGNFTWAYTSGYQNRDRSIMGFSHNRLSGTGCHDLGDVLLMPFTGDYASPTIAAQPGARIVIPATDDFSSPFSKDNETAEPGYYSVKLDAYDIVAQMSATEHAAIHSYKYNGKDQPHLLIDFQSAMVSGQNQFHTHVLESEQTFEDDYTISGWCRTLVWLDRTYYYVIEFDKPYTKAIELTKRDPREKAPRYVLDFDMKPGDELKVKVSVSSKSVEGARNNIAQEIPGWNLNKVRKDAAAEWGHYLSLIEIEGTQEQKDVFYTSMYHLFIHPNNIADAGENPYYSTFSFWDTYRAAHPLYTILTPDIVDYFVQSALGHYDQQGFLPIWALWGGDNYCMIGNHCVPVIVDAYLKGHRNFDVEKAYEAVKRSLTEDHIKSDWTVLDKYGYLPYDIIDEESVSRTLEYAYDDYCAAQFAKALGKQADYEFFLKRSEYYRNVFDPQTGFMRPKDSKGRWATPFSPFALAQAGNMGGQYTEGNAWQYTWHVQQNFEGLAELYGGHEQLVTKLDSLFTVPSEVEGAGEVSDVSGLIGQYAQGNEPSHHVVYFFTLADRQDRAAELIHEIFATQYKDDVDGLCGNDDCGQMSAWYIFSALGFYPVNPCGGEYVLGAPQLAKATINLANGNKFTVEAENYSPANIYVKEMYLNDQPLTGKTISHDDIMAGGTLRFVMSATK